MTIGRAIVSGFHSPLAQQVLRSVLRRSGRAVKMLARNRFVLSMAAGITVPFIAEGSSLDCLLDERRT